MLNRDSFVPCDSALASSYTPYLPFLPQSCSTRPNHNLAPPACHGSVRLLERIDGRSHRTRSLSFCWSVSGSLRHRTAAQSEPITTHTEPADTHSQRRFNSSQVRKDVQTCALCVVLRCWRCSSSIGWWGTTVTVTVTAIRMHPNRIATRIDRTIATMLTHAI